MKRNRWIAIAVVVAQLALLTYMAGQREWIARTGRIIMLRTAPLDPNDPMRGQYVRLDYDISVVSRELCRDGVVAWFEESNRYRAARDRVVYAALNVAPDGLAELNHLTDTEPTEGVFLRGRVDWIDEHTIRVRYGIEAFFMERTKARALEDAMRDDRRGVPLDVQAAVGGGGIAVLRDYAWESLGITVALERSEPEPDPVDPTRRPVRELRAIAVTLTNHGDEPVTIVDRPDGDSFRLVRNTRRGEGTHRWVGEGEPVPVARRSDLRVLAPGESYVTRLDVSRPKWFVEPVATDAEPVSLAALQQAWSASFRIEYDPSMDTAAAAALGIDPGMLRPLRSRAFSPAGGFD